MEKVTLDTFTPRWYQVPIFDAIENKGYRRVVAVLPRRAGKDIAAFNLCIRQCMRRPCVIYYILPTYSQAKKVVWDSITNDGVRFLDYIPSQLISSKNSQEMKIWFINGSLLQLVGSDNYDRLMGTNPHGCVFSEYALQDPNAFNYIRPILAANKGWAVFLSCVAPDTCVITQDGIRRIKDVSSKRDTYNDYNRPIYGLGGFHNAEQFYYGGWQPTLKITLASGYQLECTPIHPIWNGHEWVQARDISIGDVLPVQYGQEVWGSGLDISRCPRSNHPGRKRVCDFERLSLDFLYLLGLIHSDGSYSRSSVTITKKRDPEIISFLRRFGFKTNPDGIHHVLCSRELCDVLTYLSFRHGARNKAFPDALFSCTREQMISFLQGVFDGDGSSHRHRGTIKLVSTSRSFLGDIQIILLNFGIASSIRVEHKGPTERVRVSSTIYNLEIDGYFAYIFYTKIGFGLARKQSNIACLSERTCSGSGNLYPVRTECMPGYRFPRNIVTNPRSISRRLLEKIQSRKPHDHIKHLLSENFYYSRVYSIEKSANYVYDFVIPNTQSFASNGLISHNTPRGKNHMWDLYKMACESPDWYSYLLTVDETKHISQETIDREYREGLISADLIEQEYRCSFNQGVAGAWYAHYLDDMRRRKQIAHVPHDPSHLVHTAWDLGVRDSTAIIFFQVIGKSVHIIDTYQNSGTGLEHYIKVLNDKPYVYGKHIAPHDLRVRDYSIGVSRWEKAYQLGVRFIIAPHLQIIDGIEAVRSTLPRIYIDESCHDVIEMLEKYRKERDERTHEYRSKPFHDQYSHMADALRMLCVTLPQISGGMSQEDLKKHYYGANRRQLPSFFNNW